MKKITKLLALVLALALVFSLAACSKQASIVGTWKYKLDVMKVLEASGQMDSMTGEDSGMSEEQVNQIIDVFKKLFADLDMTMNLDLKEDKSFTLAMDENSAKTASETLSARLPEIMPELLAAMFGGQEALDSMLEASGASMDDLTAAFSDSFNPDEMLEGLNDANVKGTYTYEEGKLVLTPEDADEKPATLTVELSSSELKVTAIESEGVDAEELEMYKSLLPLVFTK